jgi:TetR/AcrR family transcriptional regulator
MTAEEQKIRRRDPEATQEAILRAAETLFIDRGMAAVRTSAVAKQAGVAKSLIHHYFGSKDALWEAVIKRRFEAYFEAQFSMLSDREGGWRFSRQRAGTSTAPTPEILVASG